MIKWKDGRFFLVLQLGLQLETKIEVFSSILRSFRCSTFEDFPTLASLEKMFSYEEPMKQLLVIYSVFIYLRKEYSLQFLSLTLAITFVKYN